jgi:DNA polymerase III subunit epsilon
VAVIENGGVVDVREQLIRPRDLRFAPRNVGIHGIRPEHVADQPEFPAVWPMLAQLLSDRIVLAHNASFDLSVLRAVLDLYSLPWPRLTYICTVRLSQAAWPNLPNHRLPTMAYFLGLPLDHHKASSDAAACAAIALAASVRAKAPSFAKTADSLGVTAGQMGPDHYFPCTAQLGLGERPARDLSRLVVRVPPDCLQGKNVVFTGTLLSMARDEASDIVRAAGGVWQFGVRRDTDLLVVGSDPGAIKLTKAARVKDRYGRLRVLDEGEFLETVGCPICCK